jgi:hypothetical protein
MVSLRFLVSVLVPVCWQENFGFYSISPADVRRMVARQAVGKGKEEQKALTLHNHFADSCMKILCLAITDCSL